MDFNHDDEQHALREAVRGLLSKSYSDFESRRRTVAEEPGFDEALWQRLAEMGVLGLPFDESDGGVGAGPVEVAIVAQEIGRVLAPEPFLASVVVAGGLVAAAGDSEQRSTVLGSLASGEKVLAFAHAEPGSRWAPTAREVTALEDGDAWTLSGTKEPVVHGARADLLVVSAALPEGGTGLFLVDADADGLTRRGYPTHDGGRAARVDLAGTPATALGSGDQVKVIEKVLNHGRVMAANEAVGAMAEALELTTDYLRSRKQFGVTLNTFQALTFRAADLYVSLELTRSIVDWATMVLAERDDAEAAEAASRAGLQVSKAGRHVGKETIQLHGGIAMTAEYSAGAYANHLVALDHLFGDGGHELRRLATLLTDHDDVDPLE